MLELALAADAVEDCRLNGVALYGEVQVVDSFPDLNVIPVENFADSCGEWEFVDSFPDFTVQFVDSFPDFQIEFVTGFPGEP